MRFTARRLLVDGEPSTSAHAVAYCGRVGDAVVYLDDPSLDSQWYALESQLRDRDVHVTMVGRTCDNLRCGEDVRVRVRSMPLEPPRMAPVAKTAR